MDGKSLSASELLGLFYQVPHVLGIVVFSHHEYVGVIFKRDIERNLLKRDFSVDGVLQPLSFSQMEEFLFSKNPTPHLSVPVLFLESDSYRFLSYNELRWYFFPEEFSLGIVEQVVRALGHPVVVCSHFHRVLYQNHKAFELFEVDLLGKNIYRALRQWALEENEGFFMIYSEKGRYRLFISHAESEHFSLSLFQFFSVA